MTERKKSSNNMLLLKVPDDVKEFIEKYKERKMAECGCRIGNSQAIYNLLRKLKIYQSANK